MTTKRLLPILAFLAFAGIAPAQQCDSAYPKTASLDLSISSLVAVGADVRVQVIERMNAPTLDTYERIVEQACPSWRAPDGGRKNNLIVIIVAVKDRKTGIYFGSQWRALESQWPRVQSSLMAPRFRDGDYAGGVSAGLLEIGHLIQERQTPGTVVVQQAATTPTDFSGLWSVFLCIVLIGGGIMLVVIVIKELARRRKAREKITGAQQSALIAQQEATDAILAGSGREDEQYRNAVKSYGQMGSGTGALDPKINGLTAPQYRAIADRYREVIDQANQPNKANAPVPHLESILGNAPSRSRKSAKSQPPPIVRNTNTVIHEHYDHGITPIFIPTGPSVVYVPESSTYTPPEPSHHSSPATDPSPSFGGSSDWGSSSSSSESGGSSDFGSSSSSDFSGGGGSSDW